MTIPQHFCISSVRFHVDVLGSLHDSITPRPHPHSGLKCIGLTAELPVV